MDKLILLQQRKQEILAKGKAIRAFVSDILDEFSFVETDIFAFTKACLTDSDDNYGEGLVSGYGTIDGIPVCIAGQNYEINKGGVSKAHADKILKTQKQAVTNGAVMISIIDSAGAKLDDGITALEGYAQIIAQANKMYGIVPQIAIIKGHCFGSINYYAALHDFVIMLNDGISATASPDIILASEHSSLSAKDAFGAKAREEKSNFAMLSVKDTNQLNDTLKKLLFLLSCNQEFDTEDKLNTQAQALNDGYKVEGIKENVLDKDTFLEISAGYGKALKCGLAKIGGITVGTILCDDTPEGMLLCRTCSQKASKFVRLIDRLNLPLITFVNTAGVITRLDIEQSSLINDITMLMSAVNDCETVKLSVICNRAIGAGYIALASKSLGYDNTIAWANAVISPLNESAAALIEYADEISSAADPAKAREQVQKRYSDINGDPFNAAKAASVDNIIEPAHTRQYLISLLTMLI